LLKPKILLELRRVKSWQLKLNVWELLEQNEHFTSHVSPFVQPTASEHWRIVAKWRGRNRI